MHYPDSVPPAGKQNMEKQNTTYVTQPYLPDMEEFLSYLREIWESKWLTNHGPFHNRFERELAEFLGVPYVCLFSNATLALMLALKCLDIDGEVITTPYSFVATSHAIWWNHLTPVFADVDYATGNIDPESIEKNITPNTSALLPVHVYGNPCDAEAIDAIAKKHNLKVIYDAAHAFAVKYNDTSVLNFGDLSVLSFHATKSFTTFEGGAIICKSEETKHKLHLLSNFGIADESVIIGTGLNAKMDEFKAALGLLQLKHFDASRMLRKNIADIYDEGFADAAGMRVIPPTPYNYSYYAAVFPAVNGVSPRDAVHERLKKEGVIARKYFYPLISNLAVYSSLPSARRELLPNGNKLADEVLCLPIYPALAEDTARAIVRTVREVLS